MPPYEDRLLTETEAAQYLNTTPGTLQVWRSRKQGPPYVKINVKSIRYEFSALLDYVAKNSIYPTPKIINN